MGRVNGFGGLSEDLQDRRLPVLLVHGIFDTGASMAPLRRALQRDGWTAVEALDLRPNDCSESHVVLANQVKAAAEALCRREQAERLDVVAFSMGGVITRYYTRFLGGDQLVRRLVTISSPHHGTWLAFLSRRPGAIELRPRSEFLRRLNSETTGENGLNGYGVHTSIWTPLDLMILPSWSSLVPGAHNVAVLNPAHPLMLRDPRVFLAVREALLSPV